jgi:hypothetical protein
LVAQAARGFESLPLRCRRRGARGALADGRDDELRYRASRTSSRHRDPRAEAYGGAGVDEREAGAPEAVPAIMSSTNSDSQYDRPGDDASIATKPNATAVPARAPVAPSGASAWAGGVSRGVRLGPGGAGVGSAGRDVSCSGAWQPAPSALTPVA